MRKEVNQAIGQIVEEKESEGIKYYLGKKTNSKSKVWMTEDHPKDVLQQYLEKSQRLPQNIQLLSSQEEQAIEKRKSKSKSVSKKKKAKPGRKKKKVAYSQSQQNNSFMNERQIDDRSLQEENKSVDAKRNMQKQLVGQPFCSQQIIDKNKIFQEVSGSVSDLIAQVSSSELQQDEQVSVMMGKKNTKNKKIKKQTKTLKRPIRQSTKSLDEDNIIERNRRQKERKNYTQFNTGKEDKSKLHSKLKNIKKQDYQYIQSLLISTVLSAGMCGSYKYFLVQLKQSNEKVYVEQRHMIQYFPRKLAQFYQRILNKVSKSTHSLNFML